MAKLRTGPVLEIIGGSDDYFTLEFKRLDGSLETGIVDFIVTLYVSKTACSEVLLTKSTSEIAEAVKVSGGATGQVKFIFIPADTMGTPLDKGDYTYDVWFETLGGLELPAMLATPFKVHCGVGRT